MIYDRECVNRIIPHVNRETLEEDRQIGIEGKKQLPDTIKSTEAPLNRGFLPLSALRALFSVPRRRDDQVANGRRFNAKRRDRTFLEGVNYIFTRQIKRVLITPGHAGSRQKFPRSLSRTD